MPPLPRCARHRLLACRRRHRGQRTRRQAEAAADVLDDACELRDGRPHAGAAAKGAARELQLAVAHGGMGGVGEYGDQPRRLAAVDHTRNLRRHEVKVLEDELGKPHTAGDCGVACGRGRHLHQVESWRPPLPVSQDHLGAGADAVPDEARRGWEPVDTRRAGGGTGSRALAGRAHAPSRTRRLSCAQRQQRRSDVVGEASVALGVVLSHALPVNNAAEVGAGLPDHDLRARVAPQLRLAAPRHGLDGVAQLDGVGAIGHGEEDVDVAHGGGWSSTWLR